MPGFLYNIVTQAGAALIAQATAANQIVFVSALSKSTAAASAEELAVQPASWYDGKAGSIAAASATDNVARVVASWQPSGSRQAAKSMCVTARLASQSDAQAVPMIALSDPESTIELPGADDTSGAVSIPFLAEINASGDVEATPGASASIADLARFVSLHSAGNPLTGDDQTILGVKTFASGVAVPSGVTLAVGGTLAVSGTTSVSGTASFVGIAASGDVTISGTLSAGAATVTSVTTTGAASIGGNATVTGSTTSGSVIVRKDEHDLAFYARAGAVSIGVPFTITATTYTRDLLPDYAGPQATYSLGGNDSADQKWLGVYAVTLHGDLDGLIPMPSPESTPATNPHGMKIGEITLAWVKCSVALRFRAGDAIDMSSLSSSITEFCVAVFDGQTATWGAGQSIVRTDDGVGRKFRCMSEGYSDGSSGCVVLLARIPV